MRGKVLREIGKKIFVYKIYILKKIFLNMSFIVLTLKTNSVSISRVVSIRNRKHVINAPCELLDKLRILFFY